MARKIEKTPLVAESGVFDCALVILIQF